MSPRDHLADNLDQWLSTATVPDLEIMLACIEHELIRRGMPGSLALALVGGQLRTFRDAYHARTATPAPAPQPA